MIGEWLRQGGTVKFFILLQVIIVMRRKMVWVIFPSHFLFDLQN